jgi:hypothetical protein
MPSKAEDVENRFITLRTPPDLHSGDGWLLDRLNADFLDRSDPDAAPWFLQHLVEVEARYTPNAIERRARLKQRHEKSAPSLMVGSQ